MHIDPLVRSWWTTRIPRIPTLQNLGHSYSYIIPTGRIPRTPTSILVLGLGVHWECIGSFSAEFRCFEHTSISLGLVGNIPAGVLGLLGFHTGLCSEYVAKCKDLVLRVV